MLSADDQTEFTTGPSRAPSTNLPGKLSLASQRDDEIAQSCSSCNVSRTEFLAMRLDEYLGSRGSLRMPERYDMLLREGKAIFESENRTGYLNLDTATSYSYSSAKTWLQRIQRDTSSSESAMHRTTTARLRLMPRRMPSATPSSAECASVSPKYAMRRHTTKEPSGPAGEELGNHPAEARDDPENENHRTHGSRKSG